MSESSPTSGASSPLVIIGAGGTGGHMFPANAFATELRRRGWRVGLMSDARGVKYAEGFPADWIEEIQAATFASKRPDKVIGAGMKILKGISEAKARMAEDRPALVAGFGGYPAFPALAAARRSGIPILIHEQNAVLGRVNRRFAKYAAAIACGFDVLDGLPASAEDRKHVTGNPVRPAIMAVRDRPLPSTEDGFTILITGGSQGSRIFGEALPLAFTRMPADWRARLKLVHQVRQEQVEQVTDMYRQAGIEAEVSPFFSDMAKRLAECHLIVARAGAGTISEIAAVGRPSILIPLAIAMDDHQTANASALVDVGAADLVMEANLYPDLIGELIRTRLTDVRELRQRAALAKAVAPVDATRDLADLAEKVSSVA